MSDPLTIREHEVWKAGVEAMRTDVMDTLRYVIKMTEKASLDELHTTEVGRQAAVAALTATLYGVRDAKVFPPEVQS